MPKIATRTASPSPDVEFSGTEGIPARIVTFAYAGASRVELANLRSESGNNAINFQHTVQAGDHQSNTIRLSASDLSLNGATMKHPTTGKDARIDSIALGIRGFTDRVSGELPDPAMVQSVTISSDPGTNGVYGAGDSITVEITYGHEVVLKTTDGTPCVAITIGDNVRKAAYSDTDDTGQVLTFSYTVVAEDNDQDGVSIAANSLALNGGIIRGAGTTINASLDHAAVSAKIDQRVNLPALPVNIQHVRITSDPGDDETYAAGDVITVAVTYNRPVAVDTTKRTPYMILNLDNASRHAGENRIKHYVPVIEMAWDTQDEGKRVYVHMDHADVDTAFGTKTFHPNADVALWPACSYGRTGNEPDTGKYRICPALQYNGTVTVYAGAYHESGGWVLEGDELQFTVIITGGKDP